MCCKDSGDGHCCRPGSSCCGDNCYPLGGHCCSNGRYCDPGSICVIISSTIKCSSIEAATATFNQGSTSTGVLPPLITSTQQAAYPTESTILQWYTWTFTITYRVYFVTVQYQSTSIDYTRSSTLIECSAKAQATPTTVLAEALAQSSELAESITSEAEASISELSSSVAADNPTGSYDPFPTAAPTATNGNAAIRMIDGGSASWFGSGKWYAGHMFCVIILKNMYIL